MISINPVPFVSVKETKRYAVNPQFLRRFSGPKQPLSYRTNCILKAVKYKRERISGNSFYEFMCVKSKHVHESRFCSDKKSALRIPNSVFQDRSSTGNVLVELHAGRCHACGDDNDLCWMEYTEHMVCRACVAKGYYEAPYPYGFVDRKCCITEGCGEALPWYSESETSLHNRAVEIYERHSVL